MEAFLAINDKHKFVNDKPEEKDQVFNFGRNKNKSFEWVFENDVQYVVYVLKLKDDQMKYFKKAYTYFYNRIEQEGLTKEL